MTKLQIIAGILGVFFLTVTIVKSIAQAAAKREAKKKSLEQSNGGTVSLHNPYPGEATETPAADTVEERPAQVGDAPVEDRADAQSAAPVPPQGNIYKWN